MFYMFGNYSLYSCFKCSIICSRFCVLPLPFNTVWNLEWLWVLECTVNLISTKECDTHTLQTDLYMACMACIALLWSTALCFVSLGRSVLTKDYSVDQTLVDIRAQIPWRTGLYTRSFFSFFYSSLYDFMPSVLLKALAKLMLLAGTLIFRLKMRQMKHQKKIASLHRTIFSSLSHFSKCESNKVQDQRCATASFPSNLVLVAWNQTL